MKVLLVNKYHYLKGGAERSYFDMAEILKSHGHEVAFFSMNHKQNKKTKWRKYFIKNIDYSQKTSLVKKIRLSLKIIYNLEAKIKISKLIKDFQPDVVHMHNIYHQLSPSIISAVKKFKIPIVMTLHDYKLVSPNYNLSLNGKIWEKSKANNFFKVFTGKAIKNSYSKSCVCMLEAYIHRLLKIYEKIDCFISPSAFLASKFNEFNFNKKIEHIKNPQINNLKKIELNEKKQVLFFGRLSVEKGVNILLEAWCALKKKNKLSGYRLIIAGDGPEKNKIENLIKKLRLQDDVLLIGHQTSDKMADCVANSKIIALPSVCYENSPYSVLEAMGAGKIVLASKIGGFKEMLSEGRGMFFEPGNGEDLALRLEELMNMDERQSLVMRQKCKDYINNEHSSLKFYNKLLDIYLKLAKK